MSYTRRDFDRATGQRAPVGFIIVVLSIIGTVMAMLLWTLNS
jgi:hypothetical protein